LFDYTPNSTEVAPSFNELDIETTIPKSLELVNTSEARANDERIKLEVIGGRCDRNHG